MNSNEESQAPSRFLGFKTLFGLTRHQLIMVLILLCAFSVRFYNLNYNIPFNDEAIYTVVGKLGIFEKDWLTYNADSWMAGSQYMYPTMAALSSKYMGVFGARLLNVLFGVLAIELVYAIGVLLAGENAKKYWAGIIAAAIIGGSTIAMYVSRLATYDMPGVLFFLYGLYFLLLAEQKDKYTSQNYFLSSLFLFISFLTKITSVFYIPFLVIYSFWKVRKSGAGQWIKYFFIPLTISYGIYFILHIPNFLTFSKDNALTEYASYSEIISVYMQNSTHILVLFGLGTAGMLFVLKEWKKWLALCSAAFVIIAVHLLTHRLSTFDKHILFNHIFLALIAGLGIAGIMSKAGNKLLKSVVYIYTVIVVSSFWITSYNDLDKFNNSWTNTSETLQYLSENIKPGDRLLTQIGASSVLYTYDKNYPFNVYTFDYFNYRDLTGDKAYIEAVKAGYFDYIQLAGEGVGAKKAFKSLNTSIEENIQAKYTLAYKNKDSIIYKKKS